MVSIITGSTVDNWVKIKYRPISKFGKQKSYESKHKYKVLTGKKGPKKKNFSSGCKMAS